MISYIAIFLSLVSVIIFFIILIRFKKLFSTEHILEKTKKYMENMINDINTNANRDMELMNESSKRMRSLLRDADLQISKFNEASERLKSILFEVEKISNGRGKPQIYQTNKNISEIPSIATAKKNAASKSMAAKAYSKFSPDDSFKINNKIHQNSLFDDEVEQKSILKDETLITPDGAALKEVPLIITKIYDDEKIKTGEKEKNLNEKVQMLYDAGHGVEEIAAELSCSITEVQLIIDMLG